MAKKLPCGISSVRSSTATTPSKLLVTLTKRTSAGEAA